MVGGEPPVSSVDSLVSGFHRDGPCVDPGSEASARTWPPAGAGQLSQRLSHSSTHRNAGGLNFRVRDGYGCFPAALAALTPTRGIEPRRDGAVPTSVVVAVCTCDPVNARTRLIGRSNDWWLRSVSARGLNASLPRRVHPESIELVFYERSRRRFFFGWVSGLDAFSRYPVVRSCPAAPSRTTGTPVAPNRSSSRTIRSFPSSVKHTQ